jgi:DNA-binding transcriptional regulator YiaG
MNMFTGKKIRELRERLGLSRTQLAARLGVTEGAVWKWEADQQHPRWTSLVKLNEMEAEEAKKNGAAK